MNDNLPPGPPAFRSCVVAPADTAKVAVGQRIIIVSMVIVVIAIGVSYTTFGATPAGKWVGIGFDALTIVVGIVGVVYLGLALKLPIWAIVLGSLAMFVAFVNLVALALLNGRAVKLLKGAGYRIGFLGSSRPS